MTITLLFLAAIMAVAVWWLLKPTLGATPWASGPNDVQPADGTLSMPPAKVALGVFLAVVTSLFALFISAYVMRMEVTDWRPLDDPGILWANTGLLLLGSVAFQFARSSALANDPRRTKLGLLAGGVLTLCFLLGQALAWRELNATGDYSLLYNPANAFFYLLTALHGLHLLGGMWVWGKTTLKIMGGAKAEDVRLSVELCTVYWHYLLLVWVVLFAVLLMT